MAGYFILSTDLEDEVETSRRARLLTAELRLLAQLAPVPYPADVSALSQTEFQRHDPAKRFSSKSHTGQKLYFQPDEISEGDHMGRRIAAFGMETLVARMRIAQSICLTAVALTGVAPAQNNIPAPAYAQYRRALLLENRGDLEGALAAFTAALRIDPRLAEAYTDRGKIFLSRGEVSPAIDDFSRAIGINPRHAAPYNNRAIAHVQAGNLEDAMADLNHAIRFNSRFAEAYMNRGNVRLRLGNAQGALQDLDKAIKLYPRFGANGSSIVFPNPGLAHAYVNRGLALYAQGRIDEAIADYDRAIESNPTLFQAH